MRLRRDQALARRACSNVRQHVVGRDASAGAAASEIVGPHMVFGQQAAHGRAYQTRGRRRLRRACGAGRRSGTRRSAGRVAATATGRSAAASMLPSRSPGATSSCSCLKISRNTPSAGDGTSTVTLSVSSSMSGSSRTTGSPGALSQRRTCDRVPSDSSAGAQTSTRVDMLRRQRARRPRARSAPPRARLLREAPGCGGSECPAWRVSPAAHRDQRTPRGPARPRSRHRIRR